MKMNKAILAFAAVASLVSFDAQAFTVGSGLQGLAKPQLELAMGGCGLGRHRGPYGGCLPNRAVYVAPAYGAPVVIAPVGCPYGFVFAYGRCRPL